MRRPLPFLFITALASAFHPQITSSAAASSRPAIRAGIPVSDALESLRASGLNLIYSSDLVTADMRVKSPVSAANDPSVQALKVLEPFGLELANMGNGLVAVVRARRTATSDLITNAQSPDHQPPPAGIELQEVVIEASRYHFSTTTSNSSALLSGADLARLPAIGDDALRTVGRIPGLAQSEASATTYVRGGAADESLLLLDGYVIREPYHLAGYLSPFSAVDPGLIGEMEVFSGGFPARFGGRLSGIFDLHTPVPATAPEYDLGIGFFNASARGASPVNAVEGLDWLAMGRIGTLGQALEEFAPNSGAPESADAFMRVNWSPSSNDAWTLSGLWSDDDLSIGGTQQGAQSNLDSHSLYLWLHGKHELTPRHKFETWLGHSQIDLNRRGELLDPAIGTGSVQDLRASDFWDAKLAWTWSATDHRAVEAGIEATTATADYHYSGTVTFTPEVAHLFGRSQTSVTQIDATPIRHSLRAYITQRWQPIPRLTTEAGMRVQRESGLGLEPVYLWDPRVAMRWSLSAATGLRASWGVFHQPDDVNELRIQDGETAFFRPQEAHQLILGIEHDFPAGVKMRIESFHKRQSQPRPRFENAFDPVALVPELSPDRYRISPTAGELRGLEISFEQHAGAWGWWANYTLSQTEDEFPSYEVPRSWDQTHALGLGIEWRHGHWSLTATANAHSGWPTTSLITDSGDTHLGLPNGDRLPAYLTFNAQASRDWKLERSKLQLTLEVTNMTNRENRCCSELAVDTSSGTPSFGLRPRNWLPIIPTLSLHWIFRP